MSMLIDTDVLIEYLRGNPAVVENFTAAYAEGKHLCFSPVTKAEIIAGLRKGEEEITKRLFGLMKCLAINDRIGEKAGHYIKTYQASHNVEIADALIAATAGENSMPLWTLNKRHYPMKDIDLFEIRS